MRSTIAEYVAKDKLWDTFDNEPFYDNADKDEIVLPIIDSFPAADVAPVVHGRWECGKNINRGTLPLYVKCSACGVVSAAYRSQWEGLIGRWKFCPNCGAKMDGGVDDAAD